MPKITFEMLEGRSIAQKRELVKALSDAVEECFCVPRDYALIRFVEVPFENFASDGELRCDISLREGKPVYGRRLEPRLTVQFIEGRSLDQRRVFVKKAASAIAEILDVPLKDVLIFMQEMKNDELSYGGVFPIDDPKYKYDPDHPH
jgi:4-oxalocrotonate tautomerase